MILPRNALSRRDMSNSNAVWITLGTLVVVLAVLILFYNVIRRKRRTRASSSGSGIKNVFTRWIPSTPYDNLISQPRPRTHASTARTSSEVPISSVNESSATDPERLDHRLSVRSIVTLPPYHVAPLPSERLIAREGERAGVDTVVEYPESERDVETRREEEMQALYDIREARRREQADREARRVERREARERGDWRRLQVLEEESRARARARNTSNVSNASALSVEGGRRSSATSSTTQLTTTTTNRSQLDSSYLIAELNSLRETNTRNRRVSSVSYAELGVARHDGSRIRGDSIDSDNRPLLDSAASISGGRSRSRAVSNASSRDGSRSRSRAALPGSRGHDRRPSTGDSFMTQDDDANSEYLHSQGGFELPPDPPSYEDDASVHGGEAPPYESPILDRAPHLPAPPKPAHVSSPGAVERVVSPVPSPLRQSISHIDGSSIPRESNDGFELAPTAAAGVLNGMPPLRLNTTTESSPPAIEVLSATPVTSLPPTPSWDERFSRR